ncbi:MAG: SPBc2 prophage-derived glycosyltransferase SunS [Chlamydiae bacterium]|nr:SPBc2 prophage-derived glycosyltransferase SunS [Chlamydiota bacterium]
MITATILTKNSQKTLKKTLDSLGNFSEVIVLDSGSSDETLTIAKKYANVKVHLSPFLGFGPMHNYATKLANHDWILSIDSDEILSKELSKEILSLELDPEKIYSVQRHNFFNGKRIKWCGGWHPDWVTRLYHRSKTGFSEDLVHEKVKPSDLILTPLKHPLSHTPYAEIGDFLDKMQCYSELFAEQNAGEIATVPQALFHSWFAFIKSYLFKLGFLGGKEGFIISMYNGHSAFYKYLKLAERSKN